MVVHDIPVVSRHLETASLSSIGVLEANWFESAEEIACKEGV